MAMDIWDRVADALAFDVASALAKHRAKPLYQVMGSEIERAFAAYFEVAGAMHLGVFKLVNSLPDPDPNGGFFLLPQAQIGEYRVDFIFGSFMDPRLSSCVAIELDGHEWHERTKEQAARDKSRDRALSVSCGRVIRFTGSEIYRDMSRCALETVTVYSAIVRGGA